MRNTEEIAQAVLLNANKLKFQKQKRLQNKIIMFSGVLSLFLIIIMANFIPNFICDEYFYTNTAGFSASIFSNAKNLSYIIIGILSFLLGVFVTIFCFIIKFKNKKED